ncbi:MAG: DoxX family protein [Pirellulales bacterium]
MPSRFSIGWSTVVMLVLLRVVIGWHFFSEGLAKFAKPFSSEGFLKQAKGPLADSFQSVLPDYHGWKNLHRVPAGEGETPAYKLWAERVKNSWEDREAQVSDHFGFDAAQKEKAKLFLAHAQQSLDDFLEENKEAFDTHEHELRRLAKAEAEPGSRDVPYKRERLETKAKQLDGEAAGWTAWAKKQELNLHEHLLDLATSDQQRIRGSLPAAPRQQLDWVNTVISYTVLGVGVCLMVGLFTRLALVVGAVFLLSVISTQPPWVPDTQPVYYQLGELLSMLTLATTRVGQWGGLDFFVHNCCGRSCSAGKA